MSTALSRREFLGTTAGLLAAGAFAAEPKPARPNILFINTDQQGLDTISALGCRYVHTPNMDRLVRRGTAFLQSHSADPVCCPARASWFTGRPPAENGVVLNEVPIVGTMPDLGQWLRREGYEAVYAGKWHIPGRDVRQSFLTLPGGSGQGEHADAAVSRACQGYLRNRKGARPFFLVAGFLQPHDICYWLRQHATDPGELPYPELADKLPPLPPNFEFDPREPEVIRKRRPSAASPERPRNWSPLHWRYYIWSYYRHVEMADAEVGRVLDALEDSDYADNTLVIFAADHGEGRGRHQMVTKHFLYDEAVKVPLIVAWPGRVPEGRTDDTHLVSGLDFAPTVCDYAGVKPPPKARGLSLRPLLEGQKPPWRDFLVSSSGITGRMVRTKDHKYIVYKDDPAEQLFDMARDPWETKNLAGDAAQAPTLARHRTLLADWEGALEHAPIRPRPPRPKGPKGKGA
ncbi:MAG TPA: sulfatase-like hydrolase/transferase [Planctomycetota bacterium]|nr:sulfatase-like hydrolase/transferase [Planctomycetota bacterium]